MGSGTIIFDIDDTIVQTGGLEDTLFPEAIRKIQGEVYIRPFWKDYTHVTDAGILEGISADNGMDSLDAEAVKSTFYSLLKSQFDMSPCVAVAGAAEMLCTLRSKKSFAIGFATGGWAKTALLKLDSAGVDHSGLPLYSSDDAVSRTEIMELCARRLNAEPDRTLYVGDGLWDIEACKELGWHFVGVGPAVKSKTRNWIEDYNSRHFFELVNELFAI